MIKVNEIAFIAYPTTDKQRARDFYQGLLGFTPTLDLDMGENYWIEFDLGNSTFAISNYWDPAAEPRMGPAAALEVEDFEATVAMLKSKGVAFSEEVKAKTCSMAMVTDPDGNSLWIHKLAPDRGTYQGPEIPFIAYPVTDRKKAEAFYVGLLGLKKTEPEHELPDGFWAEYNIGSGTLALCSYWKPAAKPSMGPSIAFEVDDFDAAIAELKASGVPFPMEPSEFPGCHFSVVTDPDGNSIIIHKRKHSHP